MNQPDYKALRQQIAKLIETKMGKAQRISYLDDWDNDFPYLQTDYEVYMQLADTIIPMVKTAIKKKITNNQA